METTDRRRTLRRALPPLAAAILPWSWFLLRDQALMMDLVATGLPMVVAVLAGTAAVAAAVTRRPTFAVAAVSLAAMGAVAVLGPWMPGGGPRPAGPIRVAAVNAWAGNPRPAEAAADVRARRPDVVVIVEGPVAVASALEPHYPYSLADGNAGHVLFSRFPVRYLSGLPGAPVDGRVARWEVEAPDGPVVVYSVHLRRPYPRDGNVRAPLAEQRAMVRVLVRAVQGEESPVVVAGDFNFSDRTWAYRRLDGPLRDAGRASRGGPTFVSPKYRPFLLRIDHVFVSRRWCAARSGRFAITGSDHRGVFADVGPCPP